MKEREVRQMKTRSRKSEGRNYTISEVEEMGKPSESGD